MDAACSVIFDLMQGSANLISVFDADDRLRFANTAFREAFGLGDTDTPTWTEMMRANYKSDKGTSFENVDFEKWLASTLSRRGKQPFRGFEADLKGNRWIWMTETVNADGWMLCTGVDISTLARSDRELRYDRDLAFRASRTDELTGVANRRQVMEKLDELVAKKRGGSIAVLDIDRFKSINDTFGHEGGDVVLIDFARRIGGSVRRTDSFGRIGGEEFLFVLPDAVADTAVGLLERIRVELRASSPLPEEPDFRYTFSVGVAEIEPGEPARAALARADAACYEAKRTGRDRTVCATAS